MLYGRGLGFAIAKLLLGSFDANVVALSRTRGPDLQGLADAHGDALLALECDVYVPCRALYRPRVLSRERAQDGCRRSPHRCISGGGEIQRH